MPLTIDGKVIGYLSFSMDQQMDSSARFLKTTWSKIAVTAKLDNTPLFRLEYDAMMRDAPIAHWQVHAERGAMSYMLAKGHQHQPKKISKPHDYSSLHFPVGGERFRPCLEDVIHFLIEEIGVDSYPDWRAVIDEGRNHGDACSSVRQSEIPRLTRCMCWKPLVTR